MQNLFSIFFLLTSALNFTSDQKNQAVSFRTDFYKKVCSYEGHNHSKALEIINLNLEKGHIVKAAYGIALSASIGMPYAKKFCLDSLTEGLSCVGTEEEASELRRITIRFEEIARTFRKELSKEFFIIALLITYNIDANCGLAFTFEEEAEIKESGSPSKGYQIDEIESSYQLNKEKHIEQNQALNVYEKKAQTQRGKKRTRGKASDEGSDKSGEKSTDSSSRPSKRKKRA